MSKRQDVEFSVSHARALRFIHVIIMRRVISMKTVSAECFDCSVKCGIREYAPSRLDLSSSVSGDYSSCEINKVRERWHGRIRRTALNAVRLPGPVYRSDNFVIEYIEGAPCWVEPVRGVRAP